MLDTARAPADAIRGYHAHVYYDAHTRRAASNHGDLPVLVHPETGADLADHTTHALWLGERLAIDEGALRPPGHA